MNDLLAGLERALKAVIEPSDLGTSILQPDKFDRFVRRMEDKTVVLPDARFIRMDAQQEDIDRIGFTSRILVSGHDTADVHQDVAEANFVVPTTNTNSLVAKELQAVASIRDKALRRNIERGSFEDTILDIFGEAAGRDLEEFGLLADTNIPFATDDVLNQTDGWLRLAANKLYGQETVTPSQPKGFDPLAADYPENMFQAALDALPKRFLQNINDWVFWVTFSVFDKYQDRLRARGTALGDTFQRGPQASAGLTLPWKGFSITYAPLLERSAALPDQLDATLERDRIEGEVCLLGNPDNMAWGVFHEVTVEPEREAKSRRTDFVLTVEADAHYEDENAAVAVLIDKAIL